MKITGARGPHRSIWVCEDCQIIVSRDRDHCPNGGRDDRIFKDVPLPGHNLVTYYAEQPQEQPEQDPNAGRLTRAADSTAEALRLVHSEIADRARADDEINLDSARGNLTGALASLARFSRTFEEQAPE